jgi:hypothetical protein
MVMEAPSYTGEQISVINVLFDVEREIAFTSTAVMDEMNNLKAVERDSDPFRKYHCQSENQQECSTTFRMSVEQKAKANGPALIEKSGDTYNSWDRGHLVPASPMRFSAEALDATFYCPNIAPQEPWSNRCPWYAVEERTQTYLAGTDKIPGYVVTGTCTVDSPDGPTYYGLQVPNCFWKILCYNDTLTKKTTTVGFISENSIIDAGNLNVERKIRMDSTLTPRSLQDVMNVAVPEIVRKSFIEAEKVLKNGRSVEGLPSARSCYSKLALDEPTRDQWVAYMPKYRRPMWDCSV